MLPSQDFHSEPGIFEEGQIEPSQTEGRLHSSPADVLLGHLTGDWPGNLIHNMCMSLPVWSPPNPSCAILRVTHAGLVHVGLVHAKCM